MAEGPVPSRLVGAAGPAVTPGDDPALFGTATLTPTDPVEVRSFQTFVLTYTVGRLGLDDTGAIRVCFRMMSDAGQPQMSDPGAANYVTATCTGDSHIELSFDPYGGQRPWNKALTARVRGGYLKEGDSIAITFGDTREGSPGMVMQTFAEAGYEFRVMADVVATGHFKPLDAQFSLPVVAGPPVLWKAVLPTLRRPGERFQLGIKAEDMWGNPTAQALARLRLEPSVAVAGLPEIVDFGSGQRAITLEDLYVEAPGTLRIAVFADDEQVAEAGPLLVREGDVGGYWGDLHGQTGETIGINHAEGYFDFARNLAFLDVSSHQANDFQINAAFWQHLNDLTARFNEPGRFVVFPGYEWSGNTAVGGDHNVFFRNEGRAIRRSSHALLTDGSDMASDANDVAALFAALKDEDCVVYAHVGGRYANIAYAHDPNIRTALELHSAWGTFEWILTDAFELGYRCGVVCNSDGHKGRPGASYPGSATFGAYGGLTCFLAEQLERDAIFECLRRRHHYGTTGCRLHLEVTAEVPGGGTLFERDPEAVSNPPRHPADRAIMGDIVQTTAQSVELSVSVEAHTPIERLEIRNGAATVETIRPYGEADLGNRVRVMWSGAEYRGRGRRTEWRGRARFAGSRITGFEKINAWNPERLFAQRGSDTVAWDTVTTGNHMGFDVWLDVISDTHLDLATNRGTLALPIAELGLNGAEVDAGGLARRLRAVRLPDQNPHRTLTARVTVPLHAAGDTPLWVCVTTEDGHQAWSSPIYLFH